MNTRERFEEIWPVPEGVRWDDRWGYLPTDPDSEQQINASVEHDTRLDTFTRCQETTDVYVSLVDELVGEIESCYSELRVRDPHDMISRAKKILEDRK